MKQIYYFLIFFIYSITLISITFKIIPSYEYHFNVDNVKVDVYDRFDVYVGKIDLSEDSVLREMIILDNL